MSARELLVELQERGVVFERHGDRLRLDAPEGVLTEDVRRELSKRKAELMGMIGAESETARIEDPIAAMTLEEFATAGLVVVVESRLLGSRVLFVSDNVPEDNIGDEQLPVYRASELKKLATLKPSRSMLRTINEVKMVFRAEDATIEEVERER